MSIALQKKAINYAGFIYNRFLRIAPLFLVIFYIAISIARDSFSAADMFFVLFSNLGHAPTSNSFITGAAWTISVEFTFYFIFPFLARFTKEYGANYLLRLLLILLVAKLAAYNVSERPTHMLYSTLLGRLDQFIIGMLAAWVCFHHKQLLNRYASIILGFSALMIVLATAYQAKNFSYFIPHEQKQIYWVFWTSVEAFIWAGVITGYLSGKQRLPKFLDTFFAYGGTLSYSFYLWHGVFIYLVYQYVGVLAPFEINALNYLLNFLIVFTCTWLFAGLSFKTIEAPFLTLRQQY